MPVRCAVGLPNVGQFGDVGVLVDLAAEAERHGWDGVHLWDHLLFHEQDWPVASPVVAAAAIAAPEPAGCGSSSRRRCRDARCRTSPRTRPRSTPCPGGG